MLSGCAVTGSGGNPYAVISAKLPCAQLASLDLSLEGNTPITSATSVVAGTLQLPSGQTLAKRIGNSTA